ncbi:hypothetical protein H6P81_019809 [Aristolochia fimbriata]|uniref:Uncharacterized protein n=1 Tax=Aristolochia fimbriata TaxID=158543 RepID=A0AAV7DUK8_ARIFI|nr:hypothetical protein H6P81_019809 [Aristolochia fimbriata]
MVNMSCDDHEQQQQGGGFRAHGINITNPPNWDMITPFSKNNSNSDDDSPGGTHRKYSRGKIKAAAVAEESKYCAGSPAKRGRNGKKATVADGATSAAAAASDQNQNQNQNNQRRSVDEVVVIPAAATECSREAYMADFKGCCKNWATPPVSSQLPRAGHLPNQYNYCSSFHTWSSPNVVLSVAGDDAHISLCTSTKPGLLPTIFYILEKHNLQLLTAHISSDYFRTMYMIHVRAINGVSDQYLTEAASVEEIFKLAVGEIILWLSP